MLTTFIKFPDGEICSDEETDYYTFSGETANRIYHKINQLKRKYPHLTTRGILLNFIEAGAQSNRKEATK